MQSERKQAEKTPEWVFTKNLFLIMELNFTYFLYQIDLDFTQAWIDFKCSLVFSMVLFFKRYILRDVPAYDWHMNLNSYSLASEKHCY